MEDLVEVEVLSVGTWFRNIFIMAIPIINIAMLINWAFGKNNNEDMKNWAKAGVLISIIMFVISLFYIG